MLFDYNNFIAMRLANIDDQAVVKRVIPDSLGDYAEMPPHSILVAQEVYCRKVQNAFAYNVICSRA
jgi:hypothetical protein